MKVKKTGLRMKMGALRYNTLFRFHNWIFELKLTEDNVSEYIDTAYVYKITEGSWDDVMTCELYGTFKCFNGYEDKGALEKALEDVCIYEHDFSYCRYDYDTAVDILNEINE